MIKEHVAIFRIQEEEYAIRVAEVRDIVGYRPTIRLPVSPVYPVYIEGITDVRGRVIPLVRLSAKFGLTGDEPEGKRRVIVVMAGTQEVGLIVDEVAETCCLEFALVDSPRLCVNELASSINGIGKIGNRLIILLDIRSLFSNDELIACKFLQAGEVLEG